MQAFANPLFPTGVKERCAFLLRVQDCPIDCLTPNLLRLERLATAATRTRFGIGDLEASTGQGIGKIYNRAPHKFSTVGIHYNAYPEKLEKMVSVALFVECHLVLQPRTSPFLDVQPQRFACADEMHLADEFVEAVWPDLVSERLHRIDLSKSNILA